MSLLVAEDVTKTFAGIQAFDDVAIQVHEGERVGLIGPNGAGKTTFFNCVLGVLKPDRRHVSLAGDDISRLAVHERARLAASGARSSASSCSRSRRCASTCSSRSGSATGAAGSGRTCSGWAGPSHREIARCDAVLDLLGLGDLADEPIERLSLGKGRLVEVGRALMTDPKLLLLDEPSSGLDREETAALAETLRSVQAERGFAILLVEHDVELVSAFTQRCYVLDFGSMIADGATAAVLADPAVRRSYLGDV